MRIDHSNKTGLSRIIIYCGCFWLALMASVNGQKNPVPKSESDQKEIRQRNIKFRINVDEVRIDAVVLDKKGRQATDLAADDFEIYQDGILQKITSCTYINNYIEPPEKKSAVSKNPITAPPIVSPILPIDKVRRTLVFIVDDYSMSFQQTQFARMALQKFVERQMQTGDLVSIMRTKTGEGALQLFSSDKRQLFSMTKNIQWANSFMPGRCGPGG
jgi:VWFA-related protein